MVKRRRTRDRQSLQGQTLRAKSKRRRRQICRLRNRSHISRHDKNIPMAIRESWNNGVRPQTNLKNVGLCGAVNKVIWGGKEEKQDKNKKQGVVIEKLEKYASQSESQKRPLRISQGEDQALAKMVAKHGANYEHMSRDISLNYLQWTPAQLKSKCERRRRALLQRKEGFDTA